MNPRCLKETISPGCGFHLFANSVVPAGASNRTALGLQRGSQNEQQILNMVEYFYAQFTFPSRWSYLLNNSRLCVSVFLCMGVIFLFEEVLFNPLTLCLRNPLDRPA